MLSTAAKQSVVSSSWKKASLQRLAPCRVTASSNGSGAAAGGLDNMNQAIGKHIKAAAQTSASTRVARVNREVGREIKKAAALATSGKLRAKEPAAPKAPKEEESPKAKKAAE